MIVRAIAVLLAVPMVACSPATAPPNVLTVFAAASLGDVLEDVRGEYEVGEGRPRLVVVTASSAALRVQIEQGAYADVFLSADEANPRALEEAGLTSGPPVALATNALAVIVPATNPAQVRTPADLASPGVRIIATHQQVPIALYTAQLVDALARLPGYPADFPERYAANVVSHEDNVTAAAAKVALGEGDAAIVYATDALAAPGVTSIAVPAEAQVRATYSGAVLRAARQRAAGNELLSWLTGPEGQAVLNRRGFGGRP